MILVCGATGTVGSELVKRLSAARASTRALVRNVSRASQLELPGVELIEGEFEQPETLDRALAGVERVFLLSPPHPQEVEFQENIIKAATKAGARHIVKLSALGASEGSPSRLLRDHRQVEIRLEQSGLLWTHLRPQYFMQNTLMFAPMIAEHGYFSQPMQEAIIAMVDVRDVAAVAAVVLTEDEQHDRRIYELTGPESLSFYDVAGKLAAAMGKPVRYEDIPLEIAREQMLKGGMPLWWADTFTELLSIWRKGEAAVVTDDIYELVGKQPYNYDEFVRDYLSAFRLD